MGMEEGVIPMGRLVAAYFTQIIKNTMLNGLCTLSTIDIEKRQVSKNSGSHSLVIKIRLYYRTAAMIVYPQSDSIP